MRQSVPSLLRHGRRRGDNLHGCERVVLVSRVQNACKRIQVWQAPVSKRARQRGRPAMRAWFVERL
jgi:hypothetical protein